MFSGCTVLLDSDGTELGSSDQDASPSACRNTGVVLVPRLCLEVQPHNYFWWCGYFRGPRVSFVTTDEFSVSVTNLLQGLVPHELTAYLSIFKLNELWPCYQQHVNQIILNQKTL